MALANAIYGLPFETTVAKEAKNGIYLSRKSSRLFTMKYVGDYSVLSQVIRSRKRQRCDVSCNWKHLFSATESFDSGKAYRTSRRKVYSAYYHRFF